MADVFIDEIEFLSTCSNIDNYVAILNRSIETYGQKIDEILKYGIKDVAITNKLNALKNELSSHKKELDRVGTQIGVDLREYMDKIDDADNFKFPTGIKDPILSILASILD